MPNDETFIDNVKHLKREAFLSALKIKYGNYELASELTAMGTTSPIDASHARITNRGLHVKGTSIMLQEIDT